MKKYGMNVKDLKEALQNVDDDIEIFIANSFNPCGNISGLCEVRLDEYSSMGVLYPCIILYSSQNVSFDEDEDENE
ncbi:MAG: hypothetical protein OSJ45_11095 [Lachnospiraceae bacterium]|nr:hypothetical protein [Lachnospiraceae bacterium]